MPEPAAPLPWFVANRDSAPAYWVLGNLWVVLADVDQTGGAFSVMEQWMPGGGGPPGHVHPIDEWFFILDGAIDFQVGARSVSGTAGDSVWIPRGTVHGFHTRTGAHVLNGYTPGGLERVIAGMGVPATRRELPSDDLPAPENPGRLYDNYWSASGDSAWRTRANRRDPVGGSGCRRRPSEARTTGFQPLAFPLASTGWTPPAGSS